MEKIDRQAVIAYDMENGMTYIGLPGKYCDDESQHLKKYVVVPTSSLITTKRATLEDKAKKAYQKLKKEHYIDIYNKLIVARRPIGISE